MVLAEDCEQGQKGSIVITDPLVQYLDALSKDQKAVENCVYGGGIIRAKSTVPFNKLGGQRGGLAR